MALHRKAMAAAMLLICSLLQPGCASREPYPHPYVKHRDLPFNEASPASRPSPLAGSLRLGVCDFQSQAVVPVGAYMADDLRRLSELKIGGGQWADAVNNELARCGVKALRLADTGNLELLTPQERARQDLVLKATILALEYSQHGVKKSPYDFLYACVRFQLHEAATGQELWHGDVAAYLKHSPDPKSTPESLTDETARILAQRLLDVASFRRTVEGAQGKD